MEKKVQNNLPQIFNHEAFGQVRALDINGEPFFVGIDVARALGYSNPSEALKDHVPAKFKRILNMKAIMQTASYQETSKTLGLLNLFSPPATMGGVQRLTIINEAGLYKLIMRSKLPKAEEFSDWVCGEILPSIRKYGYYSVNEQEEAQEPPVDNRRLAQTKPACVYCALMEDQTVKIGYTSDIRDRLQRIRRKYGKVAVKHFCSPVVVRNAAQRFEAQLKEQFAACKVEGEFFSVAYEEVVEAIKNLPIEELPVEVPAPVEVPVPAAPIAPERLRLLADFVSALTESPFKEQFVRETANLIVGKKIF